MSKISFRKAQAQDLKTLYALENECFPKNEAATFQSIKGRLAVYSQHFLLACVEGQVVAMINGMCTSRYDLSDEMYLNPNLHDEEGTWQMIFSVCVAPAYRGQGLARLLLNEYIARVRAEDKRKGLVLTCHDYLLPMYASCGFVDEGISSSEHGASLWHQMRLVF